MGRRVVLQNRKEVTKDEFTILELEFQWTGQWTQLLKYYRVLEAQGHHPNQFYFCTTFRNVLPDLNCPNGARRLSFSVISWHQIMFPASKQVKCNYLPWIKLLFLKLLEDIRPFRGATDTPILDFWWCLLWVSRPGWIPSLCASSPVHSEFLRFTSGVTPANCIEVSMAVKPFWSTYLKTCL